MKITCKTLLIMVIGVLNYTIANAQTKPANSTVNTNPYLAANRKIIDSLDNELIQVLGKREEIVRQIGIYKAKNHIAPLQAARFQEVVNKGITAGKKVGLSPEFITKLLNAVHEESLRIERDSTIISLH